MPISPRRPAPVATTPSFSNSSNRETVTDNDSHGTTKTRNRIDQVRMPITRHDPREIQLPFEAEGAVNRALTWAARVMHRRGLLWRANFTVAGRLAGRPLKVPLQFGAGWEHLRMGEVWLYQAMRRVLLDRPGAFIDVGVNVGHTLIKVKAIDPDREYIGFEPNPHCLRYAQQLIAVNQFTGCTVVPIGISNRTAVLKMFLNPDADPSATLVEGFREPERYRRFMLVPVFVGDAVLDTLGVDTASVVKIDVEGGEVDVVEGLQELLRRSAPYVFCEVLPVFDPAAEIGRFRLARQRRLVELLHDLGYVIFRMFVDETVQELDDFGVHANMTWSNYVFIPRGERTSFTRRFRSLNHEFREHGPMVRGHDAAGVARVHHLHTPQREVLLAARVEDVVDP
jgi:FkbM family methyltransferase